MMENEYDPENPSVFPKDDNSNIVSILENIIETISASPVLEKSRKKCEHPWSEIVFAIALLDDTMSLHTIDDIIQRAYIFVENNKILLNCAMDLDKYIEDMKYKKQNQKIIVEYISALYEKIKPFPEFQKTIDCIFVSGKTNKHAEIEELNKDMKKRKVVKSDIYIRFTDGTFCGISIKNDEKATKSNYSVHELIEESTKIIGLDSEISTFLKQFLNENGIEQVKKTDTKSEKEKKRKNANALFYKRDNPYWNRIGEMISTHNECIKKSLVGYIHSSMVPYPVYEYDGKIFAHLNVEIPDYSQITLGECEEYYITKKGLKRKAAKMFYQLVIKDKKYRVEIRWKGDCFVSPQFETHIE